MKLLLQIDGYGIQEGAMPMSRLVLVAALLATSALSTPGIAASPSVLVTGKGNGTMLNPLRVPPDPAPQMNERVRQYMTPGVLNGLNPQPIPPGRGLNQIQRR
jgi:hypothetical protein